MYRGIMVPATVPVCYWQDQSEPLRQPEALAGARVRILRCVTKTQLVTEFETETETVTLTVVTVHVAQRLSLQGLS